MRLRTVLLAAVSFVCATATLEAKTPVKPHRAPPKHRIAHPPARGVAISMDEVRVVTFTQPIATVFVGNPMIADATVIDSHHAFVLGKSFGVTNLIALSAQSQTVANQQISVANRSGGVVTLNKGANQFNYSCTLAHCEASAVPGDQKTFFDDANSAIGAHQDQSVKAAGVASAR
ncbi:MAG: pilus assembly protein N-terminal domain-containing protein [Alphaproteobacteria bacterium]|nr:pilus assembly protein N-terminal domain-containing protein [Alphaproteobacteria bacterium]